MKMHSLQKMSKEDLDVLIEQLKDDIDKLEFKIDIGRVSQFALEASAWKRYHYYLSILLQTAKDEKKRRTNDSKRINKRTTKD